MRDILKEEYACMIDNNLRYEGFSFIGNKFEEYLQSRVKDRFNDTEWSEDLVNMAIELSGFSDENFKEIFTKREIGSNWRIGETIAECILEDKYCARFHYNNTRDAKNMKGNDTGADLVGFCDIGNDTYFLFGEVKTSSDEKTPPQVLYGKTGMIEQLEHLKKYSDKRHDLVRWVFGKARMANGRFLEDCKKAISLYVKNNESVQLVGILVRDTTPSIRDLDARAKSLHNNLSDQMQVKLVSVYSGHKMETNEWVTLMNRGE